MEPTTSFEVPDFYGKRIANSSENSAVNDIGECDSFIVLLIQKYLIYL